VKIHYFMSLTLFFSGLVSASDHENDMWSPVSERSMSTKVDLTAQALHRLTVLKVQAPEQGDGGEIEKEDRPKRSRVEMGLEYGENKEKE
jgi:hypothetical protein